jgi:hypothetical protein
MEKMDLPVAPMDWWTQLPPVNRAQDLLQLSQQGQFARRRELVEAIKGVPADLSDTEDGLIDIAIRGDWSDRRWVLRCLRPFPRDVTERILTVLVSLHSESGHAGAMQEERARSALWLVTTLFSFGGPWGSAVFPSFMHCFESERLRRHLAGVLEKARNRE